MIDIPQEYSDIVLSNVLNKQVDFDKENLSILLSQTSLFEDFIYPVSMLLVYDDLTDKGMELFNKVDSVIISHTRYAQLYIYDISCTISSIQSNLVRKPYCADSIMADIDDYKNHFTESVDLIYNCQSNYVFYPRYKFLDYKFLDKETSEYVTPSFVFQITNKFIKDDSVYTISTKLYSNKIYNSSVLLWTLANHRNDNTLCKKFLETNIPLEYKLHWYITSSADRINLIAHSPKFPNKYFINKFRTYLNMCKDLFDEDIINSRIKHTLMNEYNINVTEETPLERKAVLMSLLNEAGFINDNSEGDEIRL
jgi:hypothetical protein